MANNAEYSAAFQKWLNGICTAYRGVLPSKVKPTSPYILYNMYVEKFGTSFIQPLRIYAENTSNVTEILQVLDAIDSAVGEGGYLLMSENIRAVIRKGSPFYQDMDDEEENVKSGYVNLEITIYQKEM